MRYWFYYSTQLGIWFPCDQYRQNQNICIGSVPVTKSFSAGPALNIFTLFIGSGGQRRSPFECKFSTVAVNSKPLLRPSKLDCTLITFKFNNRKITPKTTLIKHWCLFRVVFSVFFWLLNLNMTKRLYYRWKPLQSSTK